MLRINDSLCREFGTPEMVGFYILGGRLIAFPNTAITSVGMDADEKTAYIDTDFLNFKISGEKLKNLMHPIIEGRGIIFRVIEKREELDPSAEFYVWKIEY